MPTVGGFADKAGTGTGEGKRHKSLANYRKFVGHSALVRYLTLKEWVSTRSLFLNILPPISSQQKGLGDKAAIITAFHTDR